MGAGVKQSPRRHVNGGRTAFLTAPAVQGLLEGGVPIVKDGHVIGAVGERREVE